MTITRMTTGKNDHKRILLVIVLLCVGAMIGLLYYGRSKPNQTVSVIKNNTAMLLLAPAFQNNETIPKKYTCDGANSNPELAIEGVPDGAKSLALIMDDPDAPNGTFTHWLVWNINPKTTLIKEESIPPGSIEGKNGRENVEYTGPCPPSGTHHYHFVLYALDEILDLPAGSERLALEAQIIKHTITTAELVGTYQR